MTRLTHVCLTLLLTIGGIGATRLAAQQPPNYAGDAYTPPPSPATTAAPPLPRYATRHTTFAIPFTVDRRVAQPVEVHLYVSVDQGRTWRLYNRQPPNTRQFTFKAWGDGEYWFASRTLAAQQPANNTSLQPELRVVVDTVAPQLEFNATPQDGGEIVSSWQAFDQYLVASSLRVEYQEGMGEPWKPVPMDHPPEGQGRTQYQGRKTWRPETRSPTLTIRVEIRDQAGNLAVANRRVLLPAATSPSAAPGLANANRPADPFARYGQPSAGAVPWPSDNLPQSSATGPQYAASQQRAPIAPGTSLSAGTGQAGPPRHSPGHGPGMPHQTASQQIPAQPASSQMHLLETTPPAGAAHAPEDNLAGGEAGDSSAGTSSTWPKPSIRGNHNSHAGKAAPAHSAGPGSAAKAELPLGERPHMTNSTRFHLEYDVDTVGASGVAEVQLWATEDGGRTWRMWSTDEDLQSPFDVEVEQEGVFGFQVVVVGRNGMSGRRPRTGDPAHLWVAVDTTPPSAELTAAAYGQHHDAGKLIIQWQAADAHLDPRPITLAYAESSDGPWTVIASALPNTGRFAWPADPQLPSNVFLKLEVYDAAGNTATDQTDEPISIDGLAPQARIRGLQPVEDMDREAFRRPRRS